MQEAGERMRRERSNIYGFIGVKIYKSKCAGLAACDWKSVIAQTTNSLARTLPVPQSSHGKGCNVSSHLAKL